ncbi:MAG: flagellar biosynthesis anti-sigma factor FlgM [Lachnospiraceae bacterium]|nr:flagellar biosynthesis anti-sigma factor FlgM [Lachnospiraceae bacterium]MDE7239347.1 flagellar biosynthesis anti-sigma factor FlgM [Lachnospiraceae bacterium]
MRIGGLTQVQQLYNTQKKTDVKKKSGSSFADQVQISSLGKDYQTAKAAVANSPDVREDLVASLKERIQNGTYEVDGGDFADKLIKAYGAL